MTIQKSLQSQPIHGVYAIADNVFRPEVNCAQLAEDFLKGGVRVVQLRMKRDLGLILDTTKEIISLKKRYDFTFIINDYVEIAKEVGADGVHVGKDDMPIAEVRKLVGGKMLIGYSSHSLEEALVAEKAGADYVAFGAIFPTKTKGPGHPVQGLEKLREVVESLKIPVVAIGGINRGNIQSVLATGVAAVAMISALTENEDVIASVSEAIQLAQLDCFVACAPRNDTNL